MLTSHHADILDKPFSQIKDLKRHHPDELERIKAAHKATWQVFKKFVLAIYQRLPHDFAPPHIENWCNGWQIRNHLFAYFKYTQYLGNAPIISILFNKNRLMIWLDWHAYKADVSGSTLSAFNAWVQKIDMVAYDDFGFCHHSVGEYGALMPLSALDFDTLAKDGWYRLGKVMPKADLDGMDDDALLAWAADVIERLAGVYERCHGRTKAPL